MPPTSKNYTSSYAQTLSQPCASVLDSLIYAITASSRWVLIITDESAATLQIFDDYLEIDVPGFDKQRISLVLDDGANVNYGKFSDLLVEVKSVTKGQDGVKQ
ncbi:TPA: hypothetical protein ACSA7L_004320 [Yersinia enterocolitica]|uniref:hypothetical protein n=1 Tax=Yersinia TaxID=629 RepID=UPI001C610AE0|nr:hypothetical protein [Yersinia kristensenii]ELI7901189.1 hypothetical protein [Yersinia enterocolitica]ELX2216127.1 hypothetical protein [Yersinia enterocolitica]MBW5824674.1 hypothetical protein [Yersinia kristensenii]HEB1858579.1 hypothetical protein [Yersinia enterocolitica]HEF7235970.1 hypothetical protein [Yersinia enterocolitica]